MFNNCKNRKKSKVVLLISYVLLLCLFSGCGLKQTGDGPEEAAEPKIEYFSEVDSYFMDYTFDISYDESLEFYERIYNVNGSYDLNADGKEESINAVLNADYVDGSYIEVNEQKLELGPFNPSGEIKIIDLDDKDEYVEIAVFDDGPSGDPNFIFFRYDGKAVYPIGSIDRYALTDGQGKFISWFHLANKFNPRFFSAWIEFKDNESVVTNHDVEENIGKTYKVNGTGFFIPLDEKPENYYEHVIWDVEAQTEFNETEVKILDIYVEPDDRILNWFYVELPDGEKGMLYFWIGD